MQLKLTLLSTLFGLMLSLTFASQSLAQDATKIELAGGKITLTTPADWVKVKPRFENITPYEFNAPKGEEDKAKLARITVTPAQGGIEQNIDRWYSQFEQPDGSASKDKSKVEKIEVAGQTVHFVELPGTFKETMGGPFQQNQPPTLRKEYRLLGAIIETKGMGTHFIKVTGPAGAVEKMTEGFKKMVKEMTVKP
jgi:hypothetical protein